jgi:hypothetical protein
MYGTRYQACITDGQKILYHQLVESRKLINNWLIDNNYIKNPINIEIDEFEKTILQRVLNEHLQNKSELSK